MLRDSFPIGDANGILCQVQDRSVENPAKRSMFDRSWAVVCRDSAQPVANIYSFDGSVADAVARIAPQRREEVDCTNGGRIGSGPWSSISSDVTVCTLSGTQLGWTVALVEQGGKTYVAEGFEAYDDATRLALQSVRDNRIARGTIDAASTSVADPLSFARVQAETLKPQQALAEGYRRNLGGEYAEASAYFETLQQRLASQDSQDDTINPGEFFINRALQKSNLGEFGEANRLFEQATPLTAGDPVTERLQRNFEAIHLLNQGFYPEAIERLDQQLDDGAFGAAVMQGGLSITLPLSARINQSNDRAGLLGFIDELKLTAQERSEILEAQALQLKGTALRIDGRVEEARGALIKAYGRAIAVRDGRVTSITRLRSQVLGELAIIAERQGQMGDAETYLRNGLSILEVQYPERRAVSGLQARLAGFLLRQGNQDEAVALYRGVIDRAVGQRDALSGFANQMNPYYRLLASQVDDSDQAAADFFKASQVLVRPGVAETQAILARELSANSTDGAQLFRQAINLGRDIERARTRFQALGKAEETASIRQERAELSAQIERFEADQLIAQAKLAEFPEYRVVAPRSLELDEFRKSLVDGEAYARLAMVGDEVFMFYADRTTARAYQVDMSVEDLEFHVDMLRASISSLEGRRYVTYPYEIGFARELYKALFDPVASELAGVDHLIFEPDGALLRLPIDILVADDASVNAYQTRVAKSDADAFDFSGVAWLGRNRTVSTAVSAQAFVDARKVERSRAKQQYLGMGKNTPIGDSPPAEIRAVVANGSDNCGWNAGLWNNPIDDAELITASGLIGESDSQLITGSDFTDTAIKAKADLNDFRVLHFATHGLVTPPN
ncbi:MAG: CHAT domain-containing protein, partial [Rubripirellula sp.]